LLEIGEDVLDTKRSYGFFFISGYGYISRPNTAARFQHSVLQGMFIIWE